MKIQFLTDYWIGCNTGGGNIFRTGEVQEYLRDQECIRIQYKNKYKNSSVSYYDFPYRKMVKVCLQVRSGKTIQKKTTEQEIKQAIIQIVGLVEDLQDRVEELERLYNTSE